MKSNNNYRNFTLGSTYNCSIGKHFQHTDRNVCYCIIVIPKFSLYFCISSACFDCTERFYSIRRLLENPLAQLNVVHAQCKQTSATKSQISALRKIEWIDQVDYVLVVNKDKRRNVVYIRESINFIHWKTKIHRHRFDVAQFPVLNLLPNVLIAGKASRPNRLHQE